MRGSSTAGTPSMAFIWWPSSSPYWLTLACSARASIIAGAAEGHPSRLLALDRAPSFGGQPVRQGRVAASFGLLVSGGFDVADSSRVPKQLKVHSIQFAFHLPSVPCSRFLVTLFDWTIPFPVAKANRRP